MRIEHPMQDTADQSAELKMALKRDPETPALADAGFSPEGSEAFDEVLRGLDHAATGSWVANRLAEYRLRVTG